MSTLPGLEAITVARWVYATLSTDPELQALLGGADAPNRIKEGTYSGAAPLWIVYTILPPVDVKGVGMVQIASNVQFQVKVVGTGQSYTPLIPVYQRVHELLEARLAQEPVQGGIVLTSERVSGVMFPERANGIEYRHLGGLYETLTQ
jgi:hypothetical protein